MSTIFQKPPQNYQYYVGLGNLVDYDTTVVNRTGPVTNGNLQSLTIPGNTLVQAGQKVNLSAQGSYNSVTVAAANINVTVNGTQIGGVNLPVGATTFGWRYEINFQRNPNNLMCVQFMTINFETQAGGSAPISALTPVVACQYYIATGLDFTQSIAIQFRTNIPNGGSVNHDGSSLIVF